MRVMGWSWRDLEETPVYVRKYCWDLDVIRRQNEAARVNRRKPGGQG